MFRLKEKRITVKSKTTDCLPAVRTVKIPGPGSGEQSAVPQFKTSLKA